MTTNLVFTADIRLAEWNEAYRSMTSMFISEIVERFKRIAPESMISDLEFVSLDGNIITMSYTPDDGETLENSINKAGGLVGHGHERHSMFIGNTLCEINGRLLTVNGEKVVI